MTEQCRSDCLIYLLLENQASSLRNAYQTRIQKHLSVVDRLSNFQTDAETFRGIRSADYIQELDDCSRSAQEVGQELAKLADELDTKANSAIRLGSRAIANCAGPFLEDSTEGLTIRCGGFSEQGAKLIIEIQADIAGMIN